MTHDLQDAISLEIARRVAARLRVSPALVDLARANLARWSRLNSDARSLLRCSPDTAHEWQSWRRSLREFAPLLFKN